MALNYKIQKPSKDISEFVDSFWYLENSSDEDKELIVLPDGRVDIFFRFSASEPFKVVLIGLEDQSEVKIMKAKTIFFAISLNLLAVEYLLKESISDLLNKSKLLPNDFLGILEDDFENFDSFCAKATASIKRQVDIKIDNRKRQLFKLIYSSCGDYCVGDLSEAISWNSRQINRYFNQQFGMPLKTYCNILRFRTSLTYLKDGILYPEQNFSDQPHFIRNVKKFAGAVPTELSKNKNDRFIQLSVL